MIRTLLIATAVVVALPTVSVAQEAAGQWSFSAGAATDNRSKAVSKTEGDPFGFVAAEWENASGFFYAAGGAETIKAGGSDVEVEAGVGVRPQFGGFDFDLNATHKWRVDANPGYDANAWELTADMKRSIGPASGRLRVQYSPDGAGSVESWTWVAARAGWDFTNKLNGSVELGRREQENSVDYTGWNAGFTYAVTDSLEAELRYHGTNASEAGEQYDDALVAGINFAF
jgi:uncharacterized protein (TIGR02001 family)